MIDIPHPIVSSLNVSVKRCFFSLNWDYIVSSCGLQWSITYYHKSVLLLVVWPKEHSFHWFFISPGAGVMQMESLWSSSAAAVFAGSCSSSVLVSSPISVLTASFSIVRVAIRLKMVEENAKYLQMFHFRSVLFLLKIATVILKLK